MTFRAAGVSDVGCQRDVNEDRFHIDPKRGIFIVVDGVGGQAAGGRAADTALDVVRTRLAHGNGAVASRLREAITLANNEVHRQAASRPEWHGMACVLTAAMIDGDRAVIGHVGDTRIYKLQGGAIRKITADHSPVGEREDAGEISELDAMRHPRRNEVYRDVGSDVHDVGDAEFVDVRDTPLESDSALLLCSDGLTDLVPSGEIQNIVQAHKGRPEHVARALVKAANDAGGRDNITVIYVEGERFAAGASPEHGRRAGRRLVVGAVGLAGLVAAWAWAGYPMPDKVAEVLRLDSGASGVALVRSGESISTALAAARPGTTVLVEPGEYRERLTLADGVRLLSLVSRGAVIRLPGSATDEDAAVVIPGANAEFAGFRIVGDAASSLGVGVLVRASGARLVDLEVTGAARAAIDLGAGDDIMLLASDIRDNPGAGLALRAGASPRIAHNTFGGNGTSAQAQSAILVEPGARATFVDNVFRNVDPQSFATLDPAARAELKASNWFPDARPTSAGGPARGQGSDARGAGRAGRGGQ